MKKLWSGWCKLQQGSLLTPELTDITECRHSKRNRKQCVLTSPPKSTCRARVFSLPAVCQCRYFLFQSGLPCSIAVPIIYIPLLIIKHQSDLHSSGSKLCHYVCTSTLPHPPALQYLRVLPLFEISSKPSSTLPLSHHERKQL